MKSFLITLCLLISLTACEKASSFANSEWKGLKESAREATTTPREIPRGAKPEVFIKGNVLTYNGHALRLGSLLDEWTKVLGTDYRPSTPGDKNPKDAILVWDNLGLVLHLDWQGNRTVRSVEVDLSFKQLYEKGSPDGESHKPGTGSVPTHFFKGYLEVNDVAIDEKSTIRETNSRANGKLSISCSEGINLCSDDKAPAGTPTPYFEVDSRKENSVIYAVSFSKEA